MNRIYFLMGMLLVALTIQATEMSDTVVINKPQKVTIKDTPHTASIQIEGKEGDPSFHYEWRREEQEDDLTITRERSNWNFSFPFQKNKNKKENKLEYHLPTLGIGFSTALQTPEGMTTPLGNSMELMFTPIQIHGCILAKHLGYTIGFGFDWRNYRMTGHNRFVKQQSDLGIEAYPDGADIEFSRIKTFCMMVPVLLEWHIPLSGNKYLWWNMGPVVDFTTYASMKTRYKIDGKKVKEFDKNIHPQKVTVDIYSSFGISDVGLYVRYSPCHVLNKDYSPSFSSLSFGLSFAF